MTDALSRVKTFSETLDYSALTTSQQKDDNLKTFLQSNTGLFNSKRSNFTVRMSRFSVV